MNPPAALHSAMGRERKPFTYTPGGIDLSQIKSERMAQRLMRNAMNPGVGEKSPQPLSPTTPSTPVMVPNFNCLPVQVFPAFNLPANPKSLLRTRSSPAPSRDQILDRVKTTNENNETVTPTLPSSYRKSQVAPVDARVNDTIIKEKERPVSMYTMPSDFLDKNSNKIDRKSDSGYNGYTPSKDSHSNDSGMRPISLYDLPTYVDVVTPSENTMIFGKLVTTEGEANEKQTSFYMSNDSTDKDVMKVSKNNIGNSDFTTNVCYDSIATNTCEGSPQINKSEVNVVKKQENHSDITECNKQNGENGVEIEAELTVKLPSKKSETKTETKIETSKRTLPDGSVEEVKKTITTTTVDGKTEITTKTETKTIPVETEIVEVIEGEEEEEDEEEEDEDVEEEEEEEESVSTQKQVQLVKKGILKKGNTSEVTVNGETNTVIKKEEKSEATTTRKVVVVQNEEEEEESEYEEVEVDEEEEEEVIKESKNVELEENKKKYVNETEKDENFESTEEVEIEEEVHHKEVVEENEDEEKTETLETKEETQLEELQERVENSKEIEETKTSNETYEESVESEVINKNTEENEQNTNVDKTSTEIEKDQESEYTEEEVESETEPLSNKESVATVESKSEQTQEITELKEEVQIKETVQEVQKDTPPQQIETPTESIKPPEPEKPQTRSIPIHFDNIEDVDIKPIGQSFSKTQSEKTEITKSKDSQGNPTTLHTELHREEKVVVTNRITKTLDQNYEQLTQGLPTVKTYFAPNRERVPTSPQPSKPYEPSYTNESKTERRHSLLLDRLSTERQLPTSVQYQSPYSYAAPPQAQESPRDTSQEPQAEILTVSNVKPSAITNQQWYQHDNLRQNVTYNNVTQSAPEPSWTQPTKPQIRVQTELQYKQQPTQTLYTPPIESHYVPASEPQYVVPGQPQNDAPPQPQYQPTPQPQYQPPAQPQYQSPASQYQAHLPTAPYKPSYQPQKINTQSSYTDNYTKTSSNQHFTKTTSYENNYASSLPKSWGANDSLSINEPSYTKDTYQSPRENISPYSLNKDTTQTYQSNNQYSSGYVPPPWEQDSSYANSDYQYNNNKTSLYQTSQSTPTTPLSTPLASATPSWNSKPTGKFTKPAPKAYVPPAPNQSFVVPVSDVPQPKIPGRKTYYSEYERRYISVPEATYVPSETKHQHQPNPSPQYYYDNDEAAEKEEHSWRKELREFTQKSSQSQYEQEASVKPPWEDENKYVKSPAPAYTTTPSWSQTLNPSHERTFESEYVSQDWQKTCTLGRSRPLSYVQSNVETKVSERSRGVSMDRYNPNNYHSPIPSEHPPVQSQTLTPANAPQAKGHNPTLPGYRRDRSSAEPREMSSYQHPRYGHDPRLSPVQSRSFKYLQYITGTDHRH